MKKGLKLQWCLAGVLFFSYISCSKHHDVPTADCITRIEPSQASTVSATQLDSIDALFSRNGLSTAGLQFYGFYVDTIVLPGYSGIEQQVGAAIFYNGLPSFENYATFIFKAGIYSPADGVTWQGATPGPDTTAHQTLEDLRAIYLAHYQQDAIGSPLANPPPPSHPGLNWRDSCLVATLGYADASIFNSSIPWGTQLVKAWWIAPVGQTYPAIYVEDDNGAWKTDDPLVI
jgi:hypothetical protein